MFEFLSAGVEVSGEWGKRNMRKCKKQQRIHMSRFILGLVIRIDFHVTLEDFEKDLEILLKQW
jgi:hypothetical protein